MKIQRQSQPLSHKIHSLYKTTQNNTIKSIIKSIIKLNYISKRTQSISTITSKMLLSKLLIIIIIIITTTNIDSKIDISDPPASGPWEPLEHSLKWNMTKWLHNFRCLREAASWPNPSQFVPVPSIPGLIKKNLISTDEVMAGVLATSTRIYIICFKTCKTRKIPNIWKGKAIMIDGKITDKCHGLHNKKVTQYLQYAIHDEKITATHKTCIMHAIKHNFSRISILEEDFIIKNKTNWSMDDYASLQKSFSDDKETMFRFGYWIKRELKNDTCINDCICKKNDKGSQNICKMNGLCIADSSTGYSIPRQSYEKFISIKRGIERVIQQNKKLNIAYIFPTLLNQATEEYRLGEVYAENIWKKKCIV